MSRNANTKVEKCKHKCREMQTQMSRNASTHVFRCKVNVEHLKINANIYVCLRRYNECKINAIRNAVHARMFPYGVYREGLQRAFGLN